MSTVNSILDLLQYRPDILSHHDDLIHVVNAAVRAVAKRLYFLDSSLVIGEMSVSIFAEIDYTSDTIAFVDGGALADTITDSDSALVTEGFEADMPITTDATGNAGPFKIVTAAAGTLTLATGQVTGALAGSDVTITSVASFGYLPSDFWGLREKFQPYIDGKTYPLKPLPNQAKRLEYTGAGEPVYYKISGSSKIEVIPETASDYTIKADYYQKPAELTASTDTLPFSELFDDVIADYVETYFRGPLTKTANMTQILDKLVRDGVDAVASRFDRKGPTNFPGGIEWGF